MVDRLVRREDRRGLLDGGEDPGFAGGVAVGTDAEVDLGWGRVGFVGGGEGEDGVGRGEGDGGGGEEGLVWGSGSDEGGGHGGGW